MIAEIQAGWTEQDRRHRAGISDDDWQPPRAILHIPPDDY